MPTAVTITDLIRVPLHNAFSLDQCDALCQQQQRILNRVLIIGHVLEEHEAYPMLAAINDVLDDVLQATLDLGTVLGQGTKLDPPPTKKGTRLSLDTSGTTS